MRTSDCLATGSRRRVEVESSASGYSTRPPVDWTESCRWHDYRFAGQSKSGFMSRHESRFRRDQFGIDGKPREIAGRVRNAEISKEPDRFEIGRKNCHSVKWWRGLDSNERTLALHPLAYPPMPSTARARQPPPRGLTYRKRLPYHAIRMTNLVAIGASSAAHSWWWRGCTLAARWRD